MVRDIGNRVKVSQIIETQLPQFILDTISVVEEQVSTISKSGTYERTGKQIIVNSIGHGLSINQRIDVRYLSGFGTDGLYTIVEIVDPDNFIIYDSVSGKTRGTLNYEIYSQEIGENTVTTLVEPNSYGKYVEFLKQYYISQEYQGGVVDIVDNLSDYISLDNLVPEVIKSSTTLLENVSLDDNTIAVLNTKGFPDTYGLIKINDEIITYTSKNDTTFFGCIRGFSGITNYHDELNYEELVFLSTEASSHLSGDTVENLSVLFLKEFLKSIKKVLVPGLENVDFTENLNVGNFLKESKSLYQTKGTEESFKILFKVLFGEEVSIIDLEQFLIKPSSAKYIRRSVCISSEISGNILDLKGKQLFNENDPEISAFITDIFPISRSGKTYYKTYLFIGYDNSTYITGNLLVTPNSRSVTSVNITNLPVSIVTVDSTIGFDTSGYFLYEGIKVYYTDKTINQFLGCYVDYGEVQIEKLGEIVSSNVYYGYSDIERTEKVTFRITGILGNLKVLSSDEEYTFNDDDEIFVNSIGEIIYNDINPNKFEKFANSWTYNTCTRYQIKDFSIDGAQFSVLSTPHESSIKIGDSVEIVDRSTGLTISGYENVKIENIVGKNFQVSEDLTSLYDRNCDIRRLQEVSNSQEYQNFSLRYENILSNVLNLYRDGDNGYVSSNSVPSYDISPFINEYSISKLEDYDPLTGLYSKLKFDSPISLLNGDKILYRHSEDSIDGLNEEYYFVSVDEDRTAIRLYNSRSFIGNNTNYLTFGSNVIVDANETFSSSLPTGTHRIVLYSQRYTEIYPQNTLSKFNISGEESSTNELSETPVGSIGMLKNGVEISSFKTVDKIYYGPIDSVDILNSGVGYDVINPPLLEVEYGEAKVQPIVVGSFEKVIVSPQNFSVIDSFEDISVNVTGGNGKDALLRPIVSRYESRDLNFDARLVENGGGIDIINETLTFNAPHNIFDGQELIYDNNGNDSLGLGTYESLNVNTGRYFIQNSSYYASVVGITTIKIYPTFNDYVSGINTVGFTTIGTGGIHKFKTKSGYNISNISVINPGHGYSNRKLRIDSSTGISTNNNTFTFKKHGFSDGELVEYNIEDNSLPATEIVGLSTALSYYIIKIDDDTFRLSNAGVGGTIYTNYEKGKYETFTTTGTGYQVFKYPDIKLEVVYTLDNSNSEFTVSNLNVTPEVKGKIDGIYVYEGGVGYGSSVLNLNKSPGIIIKQGKESQLNPIISNGKIVGVQILSGGIEYYSTPSIEIVSTTGLGAILRPIIANNSISDIEIINSGSGYSNDAKIIVKNTGKNAKFDAKVRSLSVNKLFRFGNFVAKNNGFYVNLPDDIVDYTLDEQKLKYAVASLSSNLMNKFNIINNIHSPIIGWSYDGCPIYGPYGYSIADNANSSVKKIESSYVKQSFSEVFDRPSEDEFQMGFFIEDYIYNNSGDLDEYNGRFCKTPEFPDGVYAYFSTIETDTNTGEQVGRFPYFIGNYYKKYFDINEYRSLNQGFDFYSSNLVRNTHPYKPNDPYAGSDTIVESNEFRKQFFRVGNVTSGSISKFNIINGGENYKVGDKVVFNNNQDLSVVVSKVRGKDILKVENDFTSYPNSILSNLGGDKLNVKILPYHTILNNDFVTLSGLGTNITSLSNKYQVSDVFQYTTKLSQSLSDSSTTGIVTAIDVYNIPSNISVGSSIQIDSEICKVVSIYPSSLKIERDSSAPAHIQNSTVRFLPNTFSLVSKDFYDFDSTDNNIVYFSPKNAVGYGTTPGVTVPISEKYEYSSSITAEIPTQSIYIPRHPFKNNQKVILRKKNIINPLTVQYVEDGVLTNLPESGDYQELYIINKSNDYIGLSTVGLTTDYTENGLYFVLDTLYSDGDLFSIESDYYQETCEVIRNNILVTVKEEHNLLDGDNVDLVVAPKSNAGLGTISHIVKYNEENNLILFNEQSISSISTVSNSLSIPGHNYKTGELVFYDASGSVADGLNVGMYFVHKIDSNTIKLCETYIDSVSANLAEVSINDTGDPGQVLYQVNPNLVSYKNNDLLIDLTDSSLSGFSFRTYYDENFNKEFISSEGYSQFLTNSVGAATTFIVRYSEDLPKILYYTLEKDGTRIDNEKSQYNLSKIEFLDSLYNGSYNIIGIGSTTFSFSSQYSTLEVDQYFDYDCDTLYYKTSSKEVNGAITDLKDNSKNITFSELPSFKYINSTDGSGASISVITNTYGKIESISDRSIGYDYSSDPTLRPTASVPRILNLRNSYEIYSIDVINSGSNYIFEPDLVVLDPVTYNIETNGIISPNLLGGKIESVNVIVPYKGLNENKAIIKSVNNSNGVYINSIEYSSSGIVTCTLKTPLLGFSTPPVQNGDEIFVENIQKNDSSGEGFNSTDHQYQFFEVTEYIDSNPAIVKFDLSGITTNPGVAKTEQFGYAGIIKKENYPVFDVLQNPSEFIVGESLVLNKNNNFVNTNLKIQYSSSNVIKVFGSSNLVEGNLLIGKDSGSIGTIDSIIGSKAKFEIVSNVNQSYGWLNNTGTLNEFSQVIPDNDYYQNLSYSMKSVKTWDEVSSQVNNLLHTSGLKNFSDTQIISKIDSSVGVKTTVDNEVIITKDYTTETRVDTINSFDLSIDLDILN